MVFSQEWLLRNNWREECNHSTIFRFFFGKIISPNWWEECYYSTLFSFLGNDNSRITDGRNVIIAVYLVFAGKMIDAWLKRMSLYHYIVFSWEKWLPHNWWMEFHSSTLIFTNICSCLPQRKTAIADNVNILFLSDHRSNIKIIANRWEDTQVEIFSLILICLAKYFILVKFVKPCL